MRHDDDNVDDKSHGYAPSGESGDSHLHLIPRPMVQASEHHAGKLGIAPKTKGHQAAHSGTTTNLEILCCSRNSNSEASEPMATVGSGQDNADSLLSNVRGHGYLFWKVDLCHLFNTAAGCKVIDDRILRRHSARGGHRFIEGRFINVVKYIAWLVDEVHAPPPRKVLSNRRGTVTIHGILHVIDRQAHRCALSGRSLEPEEASLDHDQPISRGGKHALYNIQILHRDVNRAKSTMTNAEFIALCREVVAWVDRLAAN